MQIYQSTLNHHHRGGSIFFSPLVSLFALFASFIIIQLPACGVPAAAAQAPRLRVGNLRCENLVNPLGIDAVRPRLSWVLESPERGERQTAYRVLVSSSLDKLRHGAADLWDSGRTDSDQSIQVEYPGKTLVSQTRCWWKVEVWDQHRRPSPWSAPATFSMGILDPQQWQAKWISYTDPAAAAAAAKQGAAMTFDGCQWIWYPEGDPHVEAPGGTRWFRRSFELPAGARVRWAKLLITADDQFSAFLNGAPAARSSGEGELWSYPQEVGAALRLQPGRNLLAIEAHNNAPSPAGVLAKLAVQLEDGTQISVVTDGAWRCTNQKPEGWQNAGLDDAAWREVKVLGPEGIGPWGKLRTPGTTDWGPEPPSPIFRKTLVVRKPLRRAALYICGLGYYELRLNGAKVGDHELDPAFTRYDNRCLYVTYELGGLLRHGENVIGVMLGNGFYNQHARDAWNFQNADWRDRPKLLLHLRLDYTDGSHETIVSDTTWRASTGPILHDGIRNGEFYDARQEQAGWDRPGFNDSRWANARLIAAPRGQLRAQMLPPIRVMQTLQTVKLTQPAPGVYIFDMGQDFAGRARLKVSGLSGARVTLRYGERLKADGSLQREQIEGLVYEEPFQTETYILKGKGRETWESRFTYHGFRYVEMTGFPGKPTLDSLQGRVLHTSFPITGSFTCSNPILNDIQRLTLWSYRSNFLGIPTDCPHREKNGWTGDAQLAAEQAMYNVENAAAYTKWINDFDDSQHENGELPGIVPTYDWGYGTGPAWDSAYLLIPWYLYLYRGDSRVLAEHYDRMKRYLDYLTSRSRDHIVDYGLGDWVPYKTVTPAAVTSTGYYYVDALVLSRAARLLGKDEDATRYSSLAGEIRAAFQKAFYHGDGVYANGSQTALSCALYQGLAPPEDAPLTAGQLAANVEKQGDHLDTGILGAKYVFHVLSENGRHDLAYRIATQTTSPSYGDWIKRGATTLWEDWNGAASLDHIMFGDISAWFYQELAGIHADPDHPGFKHSLLHPRPVGDLRFVRASTQTPYGLLGSYWRIENGAVHWNVIVPPNTTASLWVPTRNASSVMESGRPASESTGVHFLRAEKDAAVFEVESGRYEFQAR